MISILVYDKTSGQILKCLTCPIDMANIQCADNEAWIEHQSVNDELYIVDLNTLEVIPVS